VHARASLRALSLVALLALAGVSAVGAQTTSPSPAVSSAVPAQVADAVGATVAAGTVRLDYRVEFEGNAQLPDGTAIGGDGQTNFASPREMRILMDLSDLGSGTFEVIIDPETMYITGDVVAAFVPEGQWLAVDLDSAHPLAAPLKEVAAGANDASLLLYFLLGATEAPTELGPGELDGTATTHLQVPVDLVLAESRVPEDAREALAQNIAELQAQGVEPTLVADAWITEDGLVKKVQYIYQLSTAMGGGTMTASVEFSDFGSPLDLGIPDPSAVVRLEDLVPEGAVAPSP
jgi:hypothetical protein